MVAREDRAGPDAVVPAPFGAVALRVDGDHVVSVELVLDGAGLAAGGAPGAPGGVAACAARELARYLADGRHAMRIPVAAGGTPYQRRVWRAMSRIPAGSTRTYGELAREAGGSARSVAMACRDNPLALVVPCHRVVARRGLGGYMGATGGPRLEVKRWLLEHERKATGPR